MLNLVGLGFRCLGRWRRPLISLFSPTKLHLHLLFFFGLHFHCGYQFHSPLLPSNPQGRNIILNSLLNSPSDPSTSNSIKSAPFRASRKPCAKIPATTNHIVIDRNLIRIHFSTPSILVECAYRDPWQQSSLCRNTWIPVSSFLHPCTGFVANSYPQI